MSRLNLRNFMQRPAVPTPPGAEQPQNRDVLQRRLVSAFEDSGRGWFWSVDAEGLINYITPAFAQLFSRSAEDLAGEPFQSFFVPLGEQASARERLSFLLNRRSDFAQIVQRTANPGEARWWEISGFQVTDEAGEFRGFQGFATDITERLQSSQSASELARIDALTGLPNRLRMQQQLDEYSAAMQHPGRTCTVILLDLDRFKAVNDSLGHPAGDALLKQVSERLLRIVGDREKVFRLGGDEFQLILPGLPDRTKLADLANEIIGNLSQPYLIEGSRCVIGASVGIAVGPEDGRSSDELVRNADLALYAAKGAGRGCHRFFDTEFLKLAEERRALEEDLRDAIAKDQLALHYQPVVSTASGCVTCVEALMRWQHPVQGMISPALFIPIAEEADLIAPLGEWALRQACDHAAAWPAPIRVAVNVSPIQFANPAFPAIVISALAHSGLAPDRLELEITEGVFLGESTETEAMFTALKNIGVRLALDDFGTGYSSLGYLRTAPFNKIKIDQSFVRDATLPGSRNGAIIAAIVALSEALDMETTAEGIESFDQLDLIRDLGVSHVQGYVYSKPLANDVLIAQLADGQWSITPEGPAHSRAARKTMYRQIGVIVGSYYHQALLKNISESGAWIEGLMDIPTGTQLIADFGEGHLALATVQRANGRGHGIQFFNPMVDDGVTGYRPPSRVPPYVLATTRLPDLTEVEGSSIWDTNGMLGFAGLVAKLGLAPPIEMGDRRYAQGGVAAADRPEPAPVHHTVRDAFASINPLQSLSLRDMRQGDTRQLNQDEWNRLKIAVEASGNALLKHIVALVVVTGARFADLLNAKWPDLDLRARVWRVPASPDSEAREIKLSAAALDIFDALPRFDQCDNIIVNPRTKKPFQSVFASWDAARKKAGLASLSIHDLRKSMQKIW